MTTTLTLTDINTIVNAEPRVLDVRLGAVLGMVQPLNIRKSLEANKAELSGFGPIHAAREMVSIGSGARRYVTQYYLNEAQALLLCMFARTARAAEVRRQIIEVFMAWRRGETAPALTPVRAHVRRRREPVPDDETIQTIREYRRGGMFTCRQIATLCGVSEQAVHILSDECAIDREPSRHEVQKIGPMDDAIASLKALYDEMGRRISDLEGSFHRGANNQHRIGAWS